MIRIPFLCLLLIGSPLLAAEPAPSEGQKMLLQSLEQAVGMKGSYDAATKVFKVTVPRDDVKITIDGASLPPFMGLTTWAAIKPGRNEQSMVMGDFVLMQDEINPAMSAALESGLTVTALHNH